MNTIADQSAPAISTRRQTWQLLAAIAAVGVLGAGLAYLDAAHGPASQEPAVLQPAAEPTQQPEIAGYQDYDVFGRPLDGVGGRQLVGVDQG